MTNKHSEPPPLDDITKITIGTTNATSNVLPVTLTEFAARVKGEDVLLNWLTNTETNADYFVIEQTSAMIPEY